LEYEKDILEGIDYPRFLVPLVPLILFNGGIGVSVGFSCNIAQYNIK